MLVAMRFFVLGLATLGLSCGGAAQFTGTGDLAAVWKRYDDTGNTVRDQYTFRADGTFAFDENKTVHADEDHVSGTWRKDGNQLVGEGTNSKDGKRGRTRGTYYVNATSFVPGALLREGSGAGIVGVYSGSLTQEALDAGGAVTATTTTGGRFEFRANNTVTATIGGQTRDVTWEDKGQSRYRVILSSSGGITVSTTFTLVDDNALAGSVYVK